MAGQSALGAIWSAVYGALNVSSLTSTLSCAVYDHVPQRPTFPYVRLQSPTETKLDTFAADGKDCTIQVHIFTSGDAYRGAGKAQAILSEVIDLLHNATLTVTGHSLLMCQYDNGFDAGDDDVNGVLVKHYVATFRLWVME